MSFESVVSSILIVSVPVVGTYPPAARWLTYSPTLSRVLLVSLFIAFAGFACAALGIVQTRFAVASSAPLVQIGYVKLAYDLFRRTQRREPVDVAFKWSPGLAPDRILAIGVGVGGMLPFLYFVAKR